MLAEQNGNLWMKFEKAEVYIRVSKRCVGQNETSGLLAYLYCVQLANIITPEKYEKTGIFTRMVAKIQSMTDLPLYLENTRNDFAEALIARHGWEIVRKDALGQYDLIMYTKEQEQQ
jgi:hypothetical protein